MNGQNPSSATVLTGHATLGSAAPTEEAGATQGDTPGRGSAPPPPPPPPTSTDGRKAEERRIDEALRAAKERKRELRKQNWTDRARSLHRTHYIAIGGLVAVGVVGWFGHSFLSFQRDTAMALAQARTVPAAAGETPAAAPQGMPNPLSQLDVTGRAQWLIKVDDGGNLLPGRSAIVVAEIMKQVDLCTLFISVDDAAALTVATTPLPGSVPLFSTAADGTPCAASAATEPTAVPSDPMPTTTVVKA